jgi:hypothetical protein
VDQGGNFTAVANVTAFSDVRLKKNIQPWVMTKKALRAMRLVEYDRTDIDQHQVGVIAQEVQKVAPEFVHEGQDGTLSIDYGRLALAIVLSNHAPA